MAIDTRAKRQSVLGLPTPGGGVTQSDRQTILWIYGGIEASELTITYKTYAFPVEWGGTYAAAVEWGGTHSYEIQWGGTHSYAVKWED